MGKRPVRTKGCIRKKRSKVICRPEDKATEERKETVCNKAD